MIMRLTADQLTEYGAQLRAWSGRVTVSLTLKRLRGLP